MNNYKIVIEDNDSEIFKELKGRGIIEHRTLMEKVDEGHYIFGPFFGFVIIVLVAWTNVLFFNNSPNVLDGDIAKVIWIIAACVLGFPGLLILYGVCRRSIKNICDMEKSLVVASGIVLGILIFGINVFIALNVLTTIPFYLICVYVLGIFLFNYIGFFRLTEDVLNETQKYLSLFFVYVLIISLLLLKPFAISDVCIEPIKITLLIGVAMILPPVIILYQVFNKNKSLLLERAEKVESLCCGVSEIISISSFFETKINIFKINYLEPVYYYAAVFGILITILIECIK